MMAGRRFRAQNLTIRSVPGKRRPDSGLQVDSLYVRDAHPADDQLPLFRDGVSLLSMYG
jgi:hypothetical protein